jgi:hypothetical protein
MSAIRPISDLQVGVANTEIGVIQALERGYDADGIRAFAGEHGAWANIPPKRNRKDPICFSPYLYRARKFGGALLQQDQAMPARRYPV